VTKRNTRADRLDPLTRDALARVARLKSGDATDADAENLVNWRNKSPEHERAFRSAVRCWRALGIALAKPPLSKPNRSSSP
jgi:ferric-dicitrate binding protein FerR (iron transport regulator)